MKKETKNKLWNAGIVAAVFAPGAVEFRNLLRQTKALSNIGQEVHNLSLARDLLKENPKSINHILEVAKMDAPKSHVDRLIEEIKPRIVYNNENELISKTKPHMEDLGWTDNDLNLYTSELRKKIRQGNNISEGAGANFAIPGINAVYLNPKSPNVAHAHELGHIKDFKERGYTGQNVLDENVIDSVTTLLVPHTWTNTYKREVKAWDYGEVPKDNVFRQNALDTYKYTPKLTRGLARGGLSGSAVAGIKKLFNKNESTNNNTK